MISKTKQKENPKTIYVPLVQQALEALQSLSPIEQAVLGLRFGLDGGQEQDIQAVAGHYGVSAEIIRSVEIDALRKLRHHPCYQSKSKQPRPKAKMNSGKARPHLYIV